MQPTTHTETQMPVFVYGTLRSGQGNYAHILRGNTTKERSAVMYGHMLLGRGIPFAVQRPGRKVVGELMDVRPDVWPTVIMMLDQLEGYHGPSSYNTYDRAIREVVLNEGGTVSAYVYLAADPADSWLTGADEIPGGDWVAHASWTR